MKKMKKILASGLTLSMLSAGLVMPAKAVGTYSDWVPGEKNANMISNYNGGAINGFGASAADGIYTATGTGSGSHGWRLFGGLRWGLNSKVENSTTYVVSTKVKS